MMAMKDMRTATPSGQSVPFWIDQTCFEGKNLGCVSDPVTEAGIKMITMNRQIMFMVDPYALNRAIQRVGILDMQAWIIITRTVRRKTCQSLGTYDGCVMDAEARIIAERA